MAKSNVKKTRCAGQWTEARYNSFITSALRRASCRWAPKNIVKKEAKTARNTYTCAICKKSVGNKSIRIDHIVPVVGEEGFKDWNTFIDRLFVEKDGLRAICTPCHDKITAEQKEARKSKSACEEAGKQLEFNYSEQNDQYTKRAIYNGKPKLATGGADDNY
jgi:hypothetical protein